MFLFGGLSWWCKACTLSLTYFSCEILSSSNMQKWSSEQKEQKEQYSSENTKSQSLKLNKDSIIFVTLFFLNLPVSSFSSLFSSTATLPFHF